MKLHFKLSILILFVLFFRSIIPAQTFDKTYDIGTWIIQQSFPLDDNSNLSTAVSPKNISVLKTDEKGNAVWNKIYQFENFSTYNNYYNLSTKTNDGGFVIIRTSFSVFSHSSIIYLVKFSLEGDLLWTKTFEYSDYAYQAVSVIQTLSDEFIILAETNSCFILIQTDSEGELIWDKLFHYTSVEGNYSSNLLLLDASSFLVRRENGLFAFNMSGDLVWEKELNFKTSFASPTQDGNIVISGDGVLLKITPDGEEIWKRYFDGNINFVWGMQDLTSTLIIDNSKIVNVTNYGIVLWEKEIGQGDVFSLTETEDHSLLVSGHFEDWNRPRLIKMDQEGNFVVFDLIVRQIESINSFNNIQFSWRAPAVPFINIEYSTDDGDSWITIEENYPSDSLQYNWIVPNTPGDNCHLRIVDSSNPEYDDRNVGSFAIFDYIDYDYIAANEILMWLSNKGEGSHDPRSEGSGLYWPGGENATIAASFQDGLVFGGKRNGKINVNGNTYRQGLYPGPIFEDGTLPDEKDPRFKLFKLKKNWEQLPPGTERDKYEDNYNNWPMEYGAPYEDVNGDGEYTPNVDAPKILGDETLFYVANGYDSTSSYYTHGSPPMPLEFQTTVWAYNDEGMENVVFKKYRVINKGDQPIDDFYFTYWTDVDLGNAADDLSGCDTLLNLGYTYNGDNDDGFGYGTNPPAIGYQLVQGPIVDGGESDSAYFNGGWRRGFKNLPMTNFFNFIKGSIEYSDAEQGDYEGTLEFYNFFQTLTKSGNDIFDPLTNRKAKFMTPGDPVTGEGWYDGEGWLLNDYNLPPRDVRFSVTAGPFNFEPGDTQEVVYAIHLARGNDNLNSITKLKEQAIAVQQFYNGKILTGVNDEITETPEKFELYQNYPNPFNPETIIKYQLASKSRVEIIVFDILGRRVAKLVDKEQSAGYHQIIFGGSNLASGIYLVSMKAANFHKSIKAVLLR